MNENKYITTNLYWVKNGTISNSFGQLNGFFAQSFWEFMPRDAVITVLLFYIKRIYILILKVVVNILYLQ